MLQSAARWIESSSFDESAADEIMQKLELHPFIARLLVLRGYTRVEQVEAFLHGAGGELHDPLQMDQMREAADRIRSAIDQGEKILIFGDYDADGVSSTSLMVRMLRMLGASFDFYIPHRVQEGYGLNCDALTWAKEQGFSLVVTVDTGISAVDEVRHASDIGLEVVITDHHEPPPQLPQAVAVVNPKKPGCGYPFKSLAGVGVAFKLAQVLLERLPEELLDLAALGTVADMMPLIGENRIIVRLGLERLRQDPGAGMKALMHTAGIERQSVDAGRIGFSLAPRINAAGRLDSAAPAVRLLTADDESAAQELAQQLDAQNTERQQIVEDTLNEALHYIEEQGKQHARVLVAAGSGWNAGVIGIVASKLLDRYYRPVIVLSIDAEQGKAKGSARSIEGFNLYEALTKCSDLLEHYGGHEGAAGMTVSVERLGELEQRLNEHAASSLREEDCMPVLRADTSCTLADVNLDRIGHLELLAPFGMQNPSPRFVIKGVKITDIRTVGKDDKHLKLRLADEADETIVIDAIAFGLGENRFKISSTARLDVLAEMAVNEWNGRRKPQLVIHDLRVPHTQLFDFRGNQSTPDLVKQIESAYDEPAVILFHEEDRELLESIPALNHLPVWSAEAPDHLIPINEKAGKTDMAEVRDMMLLTRPSHVDGLTAVLRSATALERIYAIFQESGSLEEAVSTLPSRDMFKTVYTELTRPSFQNAEHKKLVSALARRSGLRPAFVQFILNVFEELQFIEKNNDHYRLNASAEKRPLTSSSRYRRQENRPSVDTLLVYTSSEELKEWMLSQMNSNRRMEGVH